MKLHGMILGASALALAGCTTIKSTILQRDQCNVSWQAVETKGIPITLEVPTHLQIVILDTAYYYKASGTAATVRAVSFGDSKAAFVTTDVQHNFLRTKKVFTIDPKHACAGDHEFRLDLAEDKQYLKKFESDVTDRTIEETSMALERLLIAIRPGTSPGDSGFVNKQTGGPELSVVPTVRAVQLFNIDDPMFEQNVSAFIAQHLPPNCAPECDITGVGVPEGNVIRYSSSVPHVGDITPLPQPQPIPEAPVVPTNNSDHATDIGTEPTNEDESSEFPQGSFQ